MPALASPAEIVLAAFTIANLLQIVSYVPQILCVARELEYGHDPPRRDPAPPRRS
jgi:hypothetical protein